MNIPARPGERRVAILAYATLAIVGGASAWMMAPPLNEFTAMRAALIGAPVIGIVASIIAHAILDIGGAAEPAVYRGMILKIIGFGACGWLLAVAASAAMAQVWLCTALGVAFALKTKAESGERKQAPTGL